jgi:hypothetical protein
MRNSKASTGSISPEQRRAELAEILAGAIVRLRGRAALPSAASEGQKSVEFSVNCLERGGAPRLSVCHVG